jgi:hypothetical protein
MKISPTAAATHRTFSINGPGMEIVFSEVSACADWVMPKIESNPTFWSLPFLISFITTYMTREMRRLAYPICWEQKICRTVTSSDNHHDFWSCFSRRQPKAARRQQIVPINSGVFDPSSGSWRPFIPERKNCHTGAFNGNMCWVNHEYSDPESA